MQKRKLARSGLGGAAPGLSCLGMSFGYGPLIDEELAGAQDLTVAASAIAVQGARYAEHIERTTGR